jgi:ubiquinone/menaquinone biosynthesis C-methylase UbiE
MVVDAETAAAFARELAALGRVLKALPPGRVLDVACGTGLFARYLRGSVVALDRSERMLKIARTRIPAAQLVRAGVPALPFGDATFDRCSPATSMAIWSRPRGRHSLPRLVGSRPSWSWLIPPLTRGVA